ncbi:MAG: hypothetical protein AAF699_18045 [Pseudomonadota bacterium]
MELRRVSSFFGSYKEYLLVRHGPTIFDELAGAIADVLTSNDFYNQYASYFKECKSIDGRFDIIYSAETPVHIQEELAALIFVPLAPGVRFENFVAGRLEQHRLGFKTLRDYLAANLTLVFR